MRQAGRVIQWLAASATVVDDRDPPPPVHSVDPGDDYLIALASFRQAILVSGDKHLLGLADQIPVLEPAAFRELLSECETDAGTSA